MANVSRVSVHIVFNACEILGLDRFHVCSHAVAPSVVGLSMCLIVLTFLSLSSVWGKFFIGTNPQMLASCRCPAVPRSPSLPIINPRDVGRLAAAGAVGFGVCGCSGFY